MIRYIFLFVLRREPFPVEIAYMKNKIMLSLHTKPNNNDIYPFLCKDFQIKTIIIETIKI